MDNYRSISLLISTSKLFEKVVFSQVHDYFRNNNLFQYGFFDRINNYETNW